ncbi:MAG: hypothetical protein UZ14_CFX002002602 [Chloroflexi bacterium OLB14]|nr:MAG: hypothetical protein UZ14_CFX002002602 [Chloroflexi bacterium OLB14]
MPAENNIEPKLKEALQLTNADWVVLSERVGGAWVIRSSCKLNKASHDELLNILALPSIDAWLSGAVTGGYSRSSAIPKHKKITPARFYAFPITGTSKILLIGADEQTTTAQKIWKLTASLLTDSSPHPSPPLLPDLQTGLAFNLPLALEKSSGRIYFHGPITRRMACHTARRLARYSSPIKCIQLHQRIHADR